MLEHDATHHPGTRDLPTSPGHPFDQRLDQILETHGFHAFVEGGLISKRGHRLTVDA
jgi:hypothetical protein